MFYLCYLYLLMHTGVQTRFPYHMMFMLFNVTQQVSLVEHGTPNTLRNTQDHSRFLVRLVLLNA